MPEIKLMLPEPPSTNRIWQVGRGKVYKSDEYTAWTKEADGVAMQQHAFRHRRILPGAYAVEIDLSVASKLDIDNSVKALLDWCQNRGLTGNDRQCRDLRVRFVDGIEAGWCVITLRPLADGAVSHAPAAAASQA